MDDKEEYIRKSDVQIQQLCEKVDELSKALAIHIKEEDDKINELLDAWKAAKHGVWLIKLLAGIVTSAALAWVWIGEHLTIGVK